MRVLIDYATFETITEVVEARSTTQDLFAPHTRVSHEIANGIRRALVGGDLAVVREAVAEGDIKKFLSGFPKADCLAEQGPALIAIVEQALSSSAFAAESYRVAAAAANFFHEIADFENTKKYSEIAAAATKDPDLIFNCRLLVANCAAKNNRFALARALYTALRESSKKVSPSSLAHLYLGIGITHFRDGDPDEGRRNCEQAGRLRSEAGLARQPAETIAFVAGEMSHYNALVAIGLYEEAIKTLHPQGAEAPDPFVRARMGLWEQQIGYLNCIDLLAPHLAVPHLQRAKDHLTAFPEHQDIRTSVLSMLLDSYQSMEDASSADAVQKELASILSNRPDLHVAQTAASLDPSAGASSDAAIEAVRSLQGVKVSTADLETTLITLEKAIEGTEGDDKRSRGIRRELRESAARLLWDRGQTADATRFQKLAVEEDPANLRARAGLAERYIGCGDYEDAYRTGLELARDYPSSYVGFMFAGFVADKLGERASARALLTVADRLAPEHPDVVPVLKRLNSADVDPVELLDQTVRPRESVRHLLSQLPPTGHGSFLQLLRRFAQRVEQNSDVFWQKRADRQWNPSPEKIAQSLLTQDFLACGARFIRVYNEVHLGGGRVDVIVNVLGVDYVLELKMCGQGYSTSYAQDGFDQLKKYMGLCSKTHGYLVVFDGRVKQSGSAEIPREHIDGDTALFCVKANVLGIDAT